MEFFRGSLSFLRPENSFPNLSNATSSIYPDVPITPSAHSPRPEQYVKVTGQDGESYKVALADFRLIKTGYDDLHSRKFALESRFYDIKSRSAQLEIQRAILDTTNRESITEFNDNLASLNVDRLQFKTDLETFSQDTAAFKTELERVGQLVEPETK